MLASFLATRPLLVKSSTRRQPCQQLGLALALPVTITRVVSPLTLLVFRQMMLIQLPWMPTLVFLQTTVIQLPSMPTVLALILALRPLLVKSYKCYQYGLLYMLDLILALRPLLVKSFKRRQPCQQLRLPFAFKVVAMPWRLRRRRGRTALPRGHLALAMPGHPLRRLAPCGPPSEALRVLV